MLLRVFLTEGHYSEFFLSYRRPFVGAFRRDDFNMKGTAKNPVAMPISVGSGTTLISTSVRPAIVMFENVSGVPGSEPVDQEEDEGCGPSKGNMTILNFPFALGDMLSLRSIKLTVAFPATSTPPGAKSAASENEA
jgi:hypothetical protein